MRTLQVKKNEEFRRRLELIQDFRFNDACQRIKISPDHQYIFCSGYHPPQACQNVSLLFVDSLSRQKSKLKLCLAGQDHELDQHTAAQLECAHAVPPPSLSFQVKVYDLANFSMKFERHLDAEIVDFQVSWWCCCCCCPYKTLVVFSGLAELSGASQIIIHMLLLLLLLPLPHSGSVFSFGSTFRWPFN